MQAVAHVPPQLVTHSEIATHSLVVMHADHSPAHCWKRQPQLPASEASTPPPSVPPSPASVPPPSGSVGVQGASLVRTVQPATMAAAPAPAAPVTATSALNLLTKSTSS